MVSGVVGVAGVNGTAGAAFGEAGAAEAGALSCPSSTDFGARERVDISCSAKASARKMPLAHQEIFVNRFPACRIPIKASGEELAPPKLAASPLPFPA